MIHLTFGEGRAAQTVRPSPLCCGAVSIYTPPRPCGSRAPRGAANQSEHVERGVSAVRILILQLAAAVRGRSLPRFDPQLGTLLTLLEERGHELALAGLSKFDIAAVKAALSRALPQLVYADVSPVCTDAARRIFEHVQRYEFVPIVAGGVFPTVDPGACLSMPGVQAIAVGEPDASLVTYLERMQDPAVGQIVRGVWLRDERGLARPELPLLVEDLDSLPFPNRELFDYAAHVGRTGEIEIAVGRGCPQKCSYCVNATVEKLYAGRGAWVRRRSPESVIEEIELLRARYRGAKLVRFLDHAFALDEPWLEALLHAYAGRVGLPFRCHVRLNAVTRSLAALLRDGGCKLVDVEVISGSNLIRNEILGMELTSDQVAAACEVLHTHHLPIRAIVYLGAPYESEASIDETAAMLRRLKPAAVDVRPFYPWPGTPVAELARQNGWLHSRGEEQYHAERSGIDMPACRADLIDAAVRRLSQEFPTSVGESWWRRWSRGALGGLLGH